MIQITRTQARRFILLHQGLLGPRRFSGEAGVLAFIQKAGCLQFDPVNLCGRSPEITLLSRVADYRPDYLYTLLYEKRHLVDHFDKNLAIYPVGDWPCLKRLRAQWSDTPRSRQLTEAHRDMVLARIREDGPQNAASLGLTGQVNWYWATSTLARAVLEQLYNEGSLLVHSKNGVLKTYDLAERLLPGDILTAPEPFPRDLDFAAWHLLRRLRAVGLLWARASDAHLGSLNYRAQMRRQA
ncbi:MAG: winged helix-turn-helix domain-containing protein, partial [Clostridiales bacterium]|nr:winged helix-turn-helix domain-containing protein [Clostridiales bacterium]